MKKVTSVDAYIELHSQYTEALTLLRNIINSTALEETLKWSAPTYTLNGKNVVGIGAFKNHFGIWFFNGVFLKDEQKLLINAQEGKTKALRQMRFTTIDDIKEAIVLQYINEAIANQKAGKELKPTRNTKSIEIPEELNNVFKNNEELNKCFQALSKGKQREYCNYILEAKRETTKHSRIEKIIPQILKSIGLYDKYKNC